MRYLLALCCLLVLAVASAPAQATSGDKPVLHTSGHISTAAAPKRNTDLVEMAVDDGSAETSLGYGSSIGNYTAPAIWLNKFNPPAELVYPWHLTAISVLWPTQPAGSLRDKRTTLLVFVDADRDNWPGNAVRIAPAVIAAINVPGDQWQTFPVDITVSQPGDLYVGFLDSWAQSRPSPLMFTAALDTDNDNHASWVSYNGDNYPSTSHLSNNAVLEPVGQELTAGNLLIRAYGENFPPATATPTDTPTPPATPTIGPGCLFSDTCPSDYWYTPLQVLIERGAISGYSDNTFRPFNNATRGQLSKIVAVGLSVPTPVTSCKDGLFSDIGIHDFFYEPVRSLVCVGAISGYSDSTFRPYNNITRGQLAKVVAIAAAWSDAAPREPSFNDVPTTNPFYIFIERAHKHGVISGYADGSFRWQAPATRGQIAKIVYLAIGQ